MEIAAPENGGSVYTESNRKSETEIQVKMCVEEKVRVHNRI
jgi:hypothetical protein